LTEAIRFWKPRRLLYNLVLSAVVMVYFYIGYPESKSVLSLDFAFGLFMLGAIANVAYCAAYLADIFRPAFRLSRSLAAPAMDFVRDRNKLRAIITRFVAVGMFHPSSN